MRAATLFSFLAAFAVAEAASGQMTRVRDLTLTEGDVPVRLVGYGLVVGLSNTGDRVFGGRQGGMTVRSVANLLRNMGVDVPEQVIRTRNAAAVLVTSEVSPYTRRGGRFDVNVASLGDATSLRGGMLWTTPLFASVGGQPVGSAQGNLVFAGQDGRRRVETSAVLSGAGVAIADLNQWTMEGTPTRLLLRQPDLGTAQRIADAVNAELGDGVAMVEDPGSVGLQLPPDAPLGALAALGEIQVLPMDVSLVVIDARSGAVAAGGSIGVGPAVVSHDWLTLTIFEVGGAPAQFDLDPVTGEPLAGVPGAIRAEAGVLVQELAEALHAVGAAADVISEIFQALRRVGALRAEVRVQ